MPTAEPITFADLLRRDRLSAGLSQEALAERAGLSVRGLSDLERGLRRQPYLDTVRRLADALDLTLADRAALLAAARPTPVATTPLGLLPVPLYPVIGRRAESAALQALLRQPEVRLVTLTGPGGVGKTRLAMDVAAALRDAFPDGVGFVDLAPVTDPALVLPTIAAALGIQEQSEPALLSTLTRALADRRLLLLLDNLEQIRPDRGLARVLADLLGGAPGMTILATSRRPVGLLMEQSVLVPPLGLPPCSADAALCVVSAAPAVQLFVERAQAVRSNFELSQANVVAVVDLCRRLDGLPLALELAAARTRALAPASILARLGRQLDPLSDPAVDRPERQHTLRTTIAWSYDLLEPTGQAALRRLAVFAGGATVEAAEALLTAFADDHDPLATIEELVSQSLLQVEEQADGTIRYRMLETIRAFALEQLDVCGDGAAARDAHARWFSDLALTAKAELEGPDAPLWHDRLTRDLDNLRAALDRLLDQRPADASLSVASALFRFWSLGPHRQAGREYLRRALEQAGAESSPVAARTLLTAAHLANQAAAYQDATRLYEQSRIMFESLGDVAGVAMVEIAHGMIELNLGQLETAFTWFTASRAHYEQAGDGAGVADAIGCAGNARSAQGRLIEATALLEAAERRYRELGDDLGLAICRVDQADTLRDQGHPGEAAALLEDSLDALRRYGNWHGLGLALTRLADVVREQGDLARSADLLDEAATLSTQVHSQGLAGWALLQRCRLGLAARDFAAAQQAGEQAIPLLDAGGARWESCEAQETLALVHAAQGEWEGARRLALESLIGFAAMGAQVWTVNVLETVIAILAATRPDPRLAAAGAAADSVRQTLRARRLPTREARFARAMDILRAALGADGFAAAWERGATTSLAEAVAAVNALSESSTGINSGVSNQATIIK